MDIKREIRVAVNTGDVDFGTKEAIKNAEDNNCELLVVATNCPEERFMEAEDFKGVPIYHFKGNNKALGSASGKPFAVSVLSISDPGDSNILSVRAE
ncbi:MAG: 50S ribosomal protein L30e [Candidatus Natronoplasma sp.]